MLRELYQSIREGLRERALRGHLVAWWEIVSGRVAIE